MTRTRPLKRYCVSAGEYGVNVPSDRYTSNGVHLLRTSDIAADGGLRPDADPVFIAEADAEGLFLEPGDLLFSRSGTLGRALLYGGSSLRTSFAGYLVRFRARPEFSSRFLFYVSQSSLFKDQVEADAIQSTIGNFNAEKYANLAVPDVDAAQQGAIADFLDAETARIDALIEKKLRMITLLDERLRAMVMDELFGANAPWVCVGRAVDLLPGFAFSSDLFSIEGAVGVRLLRGINVAPGRVRWDESVYLGGSPAQEVARFSLEVGDLVIGMDRPVVGGGMRVAEITAADVPCLLVQRVARLRVNELAERDWIRLALTSPAFVAYFSPIVTGVSVPHISPDQIASFKLPLPDREVQRSILHRLLSAERITKKLNDAAAVQIALLREHRQALITAAVTGQFDVSKAAA